MAQFIGHRPNTAEASDDCADTHSRYVRPERTFVNDENVRHPSEKAKMADPTIGAQLIALKERTELSLDDIAKRAGYKGRSSVQAYFNADYDPPRLDVTIAEKLARALVGAGDDSITKADVMRLSGLEVPTEVLPIDVEMPTLRGAPRDLPVHGTALGADLNFEGVDDCRVDVEQTLVAMLETITYVRRPPSMVAMTKAYALFVVGSSMEPRYHPGDPVFVDPIRPPALGDDVIVQLLDRDSEGEGEVVCALVKTLRRRTAGFYELEQYEPRRVFRVPVNRVAHIHRIIPMREAFF